MPSERVALESRVKAVRESLADPARRAEVPWPRELLAQYWPNWPNWGNWNNWPNWGNWGNWFNR